jgi:protein-S-isoprenylcysteine O-methyltransferase Ste14
MNAFVLIVPIFLIRYGYIAFKAKQKLHLLNYFPAPKGIEKYGKILYLLVNTFLLFAPLFMRISGEGETVITGGFLYATGLIMYVISIHNFISENGLVRHGLYAFSRNPQAISFILMYAGIAMSTGSLLYLSLALSLIWAFNEMAKSEERYCQQKFRKSYDQYKLFTRRFL